jgi:hypothetical protein
VEKQAIKQDEEDEDAGASGPKRANSTPRGSVSKRGRFRNPEAAAALLDALDGPAARAAEEVDGGDDDNRDGKGAGKRKLSCKDSQKKGAKSATKKKVSALDSQSLSLV